MKQKHSPYLNEGKVGCFLSLLKSIFYIKALVDLKPDEKTVSFVPHLCEHFWEHLVLRKKNAKAKNVLLSLHMLPLNMY